MKTTKFDLGKLEKALETKLIPNGKATQALHDVVVALQANRRAGTHSVLTKATVTGSGSKPWRQKGTGRARAGYASSPVWRGGGVVFGPHPRDYSKKVAKTTRKTALKKALSELAKNERISSVKSLDFKSGKTKELSKWMKDAGLPQSLLIVTTQVEPMMVRASRNMPKVAVFDANQVNAEDLVSYQQVVVEEGALPVLAKRVK